jgi:membrane-associated progesterone receptor component
MEGVPLPRLDAETLATFDGRNGQPIYISVKSVIYDVSAGSDFYGPGKPYGVFAGKEVSRCLAKMQVNDVEANASWRTLSDEHKETLAEWEAKIRSKYPIAGAFQPDAHYETRGAMLEP